MVDAKEIQKGINSFTLAIEKTNEEIKMAQESIARRDLAHEGDYEVAKAQMERIGRLLAKRETLQEKIDLLNAVLNG